MSRMAVYACRPAAWAGHHFDQHPCFGRVTDFRDVMANPCSQATPVHGLLQ